MLAALPLLLATWLTLAPAAPPEKATADKGSEMLAKAMSELDAGHGREAAAILKELLDQNADNYALWFNLGVAQAIAGEDAAAIEAFRKTLTLEPKLYEAHLNLGQTLARQKRYGEAAEALERAVELKPQEARPRVLLGRVQLLSGQGAAAAESLKAAVELDGKDAQAWLLLGRAYEAGKRWSEGAAALRRYTELNPADAAAKLELAQALEAAGKLGQAAALYAQGTQDAGALERAGMLEMQAQEYKAAAGHFAAALALGPTPALRLALAQARMKAGDRLGAIEALQPLVEEQPKNFEARMFLGRLLRDERQYEAAGMQFGAVTKLKPESLEAWNELTGMLVLVKNYEAALQTIEKTRQLGGETPAYFWFKAIMLDAMKRPKEALANYKRFLELSNGKSPDEEFKARQRVRILTRVVGQ
jgi:tetratricopeptide (TPR) repeat protein